MKSSRWLALAAAVVVLFGGVLLIVLGGRSGNSTAQPTPITSATSSASGTAAIASVTPTGSASPSSAGNLDDHFGFFLYGQEATVRSETSSAAVSTFPLKGRSFTSYARVVSPDGRSVAYWDPVEKGPVLNVRPVTGGSARAVLTGRPEMSGNAFTWSSDGTGLVAALDNNCQEFCPGIYELWTVDLASGATEKIATGSIWLPVMWDRGAKLVAAGVTGPGGYLTGYDIIDLRQQPYAVRSTPFRPTVIGRLKASSDARFVLLSFFDQGGSSSLAWWPLAEPERRASITFDGTNADWRPGTSEIWWVGGLTPPGCRTAPCGGTELSAFDVTTGARMPTLRGTFGGRLIGFRVDGSAAITQGNSSTLVFVDVRSGSTSTVPLGGQFAEAVRLR